jgi:hypothetical protein
MIRELALDPVRASSVIVDGIVEVTARDRDTGVEQSITIGESSNHRHAPECPASIAVFGTSRRLIPGWVLEGPSSRCRRDRSCQVRTASATASTRTSVPMNATAPASSRSGRGRGGPCCWRSASSLAFQRA